MVKKVFFPFFSILSSLVIFMSGTGVTFADENKKLLTFSVSPSCTNSYSTLLAPLTTKSSPAIAILENPKQLAGISEPQVSIQNDPTITPSPTPELSEAFINAESISATATATKSPEVSPASTSSSNLTSLNADSMFSTINQYRTQAGLPAFQKNDAVCQVAQSRAPELYNEIMVNYTMHAGFYARHLPYQATENVIYMRTENEAITWWLHSPIHRAAIFGNYTYSCIACSGNACTQIFANY